MADANRMVDALAIIDAKGAAAAAPEILAQYTKKRRLDDLEDIRAISEAERGTIQKLNQDYVECGHDVVKLRTQINTLQEERKDINGQLEQLRRDQAELQQLRRNQEISRAQAADFEQKLQSARQQLEQQKQLVAAEIRTQQEELTRTMAELQLREDDLNEVDRKIQTIVKAINKDQRKEILQQIKAIPSYNKNSGNQKEQFATLIATSVLTDLVDEGIIPPDDADLRDRIIKTAQNLKIPDRIIAEILPLSLKWIRRKF